MSVKRDARLTSLDPRHRESFASLASSLAKDPYGFRPFETFRSARRQTELKKAGVSRAGPGQSAHNFGLACDFVPYSRAIGGWHWPNADWPGWRALRDAAALYGLHCQTIGLEWDKPHVQVPNWRKILDHNWKPE